MLLFVLYLGLLYVTAINPENNEVSYDIISGGFVLCIKVDCSYIKFLTDHMC